MISRSIRSIVYSSVALVFMLALVGSSFYSFDAGFFRRMSGSLSNSWIALAVTIFLAAFFLLIAAFIFYRGLKMWRAESWSKDGRDITGAELRFEAAVFIGLGVTIAFISLRGLV